MKPVAKPKGHMVDLLFTLALFCVFAASSLLVVLVGADVYKDTAKGMNENFDVRTSLSYVCEKVRQNDTAGAVRLDSLGSVPALVLTQTYDGAAYETWIYQYNGSLTELFAQKGTEIDPSGGQQIMEIPSFTMERMNDHLYRFSITDEDGRTVSQMVSPRCA